MAKDKTGLHKIFGIFLVLIGVILYPTPIPGTTYLIIFGLIWIIGEKRTLVFLKKNLGEKLFKFLKIKKIIKNKR